MPFNKDKLTGPFQSIAGPRSWKYADTGSPADTSEVEVHLTPNGDDRTDLDFRHTAIVPDEMWDQYGPGAVGVGWDMGLLSKTVGSRVQLDIPANLAYGENPEAGRPAGALRFVVDILSVT